MKEKLWFLIHACWFQSTKTVNEMRFHVFSVHSTAMHFPDATDRHVGSGVTRAIKVKGHWSGTVMYSVCKVLFKTYTK